MKTCTTCLHFFEHYCIWIDAGHSPVWLVLPPPRWNYRAHPNDVIECGAWESREGENHD